ncbi:MAG TPA: SGNH/GDSL hydrolase family protein [Planctomycetota bacterium]|nr:SGNH/GDSL hydrolase family protein [Planctomycetota bacterium]
MPDTLALLAVLLFPQTESYPPPTTLGPVETYGARIQRTMSLLAESTPRRRSTVRVLFYGQSITEQAWWKEVAEDLRRRFPHANLVLENRAIGGFASQLLVKTAETDLYPFYPDLVIFHVYGSHLEYENIIRRLRERTTAEILLQTDHVTRDEDLTEETDPARLTPANWSAWMNHVFLPSIARKYGAELVDQRRLWKEYLRAHRLPAARLLRDAVHLNAHGCYLMAEIVKAHLRHDPRLSDGSWKEWVRTYEVGKDLFWKDGALALEFEGNRVDAIVAPGSAAPVAVRIDGRKPSEFPELYGRTRTTAYPGSIWPCLLRVTADKPPVVEEWTLTLTEISEDLQRFRFRVEGSRTGPDGEGNGSERFVSRSGRVVIDPADWNFAYALKVFGRKIDAGFRIRWKVVPFFVDELVSSGGTDPAVETVVTLAQGLPGGRHRLELLGGGPQAPVRALRVYRPPLYSK